MRASTHSMSMSSGAEGDGDVDPNAHTHLRDDAPLFILAKLGLPEDKKADLLPLRFDPPKAKIHRRLHAFTRLRLDFDDLVDRAHPLPLHGLIYGARADGSPQGGSSPLGDTVSAHFAHRGCFDLIDFRSSSFS